VVARRKEEGGRSQGGGGRVRDHRESAVTTIPRTLDLQHTILQHTMMRRAEANCDRLEKGEVWTGGGLANAVSPDEPPSVPA